LVGTTRAVQARADVATRTYAERDPGTARGRSIYCGSWASVLAIVVRFQRTSSGTRTAIRRRSDDEVISLRAVVAAGALAVMVAGCVQMGVKEKSLYERLGGLPAIQAVVDDFVANVAADTRINRRFANANIPLLKKHLVDQVCEATDGPCKYTGRSMRETHRGMNITEAEFNALVEDLVKTLDKLKVPAKEKTELVLLLAPMKNDIVGQ